MGHPFLKWHMARVSRGFGVVCCFVTQTLADGEVLLEILMMGVLTLL